MSELFQAYDRTRRRMIEVVEQAAPTNLAVGVPACPAWTAADLIAHVVSLPAALSAGRFPAGVAINEWLHSLVIERRGMPTPAVVDEWLGLDESLKQLLDGNAGVLFGDLAVHEHDLRGALHADDHGALEFDVMLPRTLAGFAKPLREAGLGAIEVSWNDQSWRSHDADTGWLLLVEPWEAVRAVNSRRTRDELFALAHTGDVDRYLSILEAHLPLPAHSLGEAYAERRARRDHPERLMREKSPITSTS
jgi:hypothetical protein